nr:uncharacterized protein LOC117687486 [Crassostrea gigas]
MRDIPKHQKRSRAFLPEHHYTPVLRDIDEGFDGDDGFSRELKMMDQMIRDTCIPKHQKRSRAVLPERFCSESASFKYVVDDDFKKLETLREAKENEKKEKEKKEPYRSQGMRDIPKHQKRSRAVLPEHHYTPVLRDIDEGFDGDEYFSRELKTPLEGKEKKKEKKKKKRKNPVRAKGMTILRFRKK